MHLPNWVLGYRRKDAVWGDVSVSLIYCSMTAMCLNEMTSKDKFSCLWICQQRDGMGKIKITSLLFTFVISRHSSGIISVCVSAREQPGLQSTQLWSSLQYLSTSPSAGEGQQGNFSGLLCLIKQLACAQEMGSKTKIIIFGQATVWTMPSMSAATLVPKGTIRGALLSPNTDHLRSTSTTAAVPLWGGRGYLTGLTTGTSAVSSWKTYSMCAE